MIEQGTLGDPAFVDGLNNAFLEATLSAWSIDPENRSARFTLEKMNSWDFDKDEASYPTITVVLTDVGRVAASLRRGEYLDRSAPVAPFQFDSLDSIMRGYWPGPIAGDLVDASMEGAAWEDKLSLDMSLSSQHQNHTLWLDGINVDMWAFDLVIWFDRLAVFNMNGVELDLDQLIAGGIQFAKAVHEDHPSTARSGIVPFPDNFWEAVASGNLDKIPPEQRHRIPPDFWDNIDNYRELAKEFLHNKGQPQ